MLFSYFSSRRLEQMAEQINDIAHHLVHLQQPDIALRNAILEHDRQEARITAHIQSLIIRPEYADLRRPRSIYQYMHELISLCDKFILERAQLQEENRQLRMKLAALKKPQEAQP